MPFLALFGMLLTVHAGESDGFDHTHMAFAEVLSGAVTARGVDYGKLAARRGELDVFISQVAAAEPATYNPSEKLALYVNAYNAYTLVTILDAMPVKSIRDLDGGKVWKTRRFLVGGASLTLDEMETQYARTLADGRVHAVVNCGAVGCPPLPAAPIVGLNIDAQLNAAAKQWVEVNAYSLEDGELRLSKIFDWYADDFTAWGQGVVADDPKIGAALGFIGSFGTVPDHETISWGEYDWSLNISGG